MSDATAQLGSYRLQRELGRGSCATVHLAQDARDGTWVALKVLSPGWEPSGQDAQEAHARFRQEAAILQRLQHPDIVAVLDAGETSGLSWLALELAQGCPLERYAHPRRLLPPDRALAIGARVAGALAHAHAFGVVHRDVKPSNVLVDLATDSVKVTDFGTARMLDGRRTRTELMLGSPAYMAPELLAGEAASPRSDLYSLGVLLFELLAGRRPHESASMGELLRQVAAETAPDLCTLHPALPRAAADLVAGLLVKQPQLRPGDGQPVAEQLQALSAWLAAQAGPAAGGLISR